MIETLFGYNTVDKGKNERRKESSSQDPSPQYIQIIDPKKSQNLSILLRALNVTIEEVHDALHEGSFFSCVLFFLIFCCSLFSKKRNDMSFLDDIIRRRYLYINYSQIKRS